MNLQRYFSKLAARIAVLVVLTDAAVSVLLHYLRIGSPLLETAADSLLLVALLTPFLIYWSVQEARLKTEAAESAHRQMQDIIEFLPDATFVIDRDGKVIAWNRALERMTGVSKEEMLGKGDHAYAVPFYSERRSLLVDLIGRENPEVEKLYEYVRKSPDGTLHAEVFVPSLYHGKGAHVLVSASPLVGSDGARYGAIENVRDVSEAKRAQDRLRESENKFSILTEKSVVGVYLIQNGRFLHVNPCLAEIFGYEIAELENKGPELLVLPEDWPLVKENLARRLSGDVTSVHYEFRGRKKNGETIQVEVIGSSTEYSGKPAVIGTLLDITERKRAEEALLKLRRLSAEADRIGKVGGWELDLDTDRQTWAEEVCRIHEVGPDFAPTREQGINFYAPESKPVIEQAVKRAIANGERYDLELELITAKGNRRNVRAIGEADLNNRRLYGFFQDITERKRAEEALSKLQRLGAEAERISRVGGWELNLDPPGRLTWTEEVYRIHEVGPGFTPNLQNGINFYAPEARPVIEQAVKRAAEHGEPFDLELDIITAKGNRRTVRAVGEADLENRRIYGFFQDITERKKAEEALRSHAERLQNLHRIDKDILQGVESPEAIVQAALQHLRTMLKCRSASVGLFDADQKNAKVFASDTPEPAGREKKSLPAAAYGDLELLREGKLEVNDSSGAEGARAFINAPLISQGKLIGSLHVAWKEPRTITQEDKEIAGEVAAQIAIAVEQSRLLGETRRYALELEQRIAERTAQLETANKELEAFAYSVSHDLRTPLRHIAAFVKLLGDDIGAGLKGEPRHYLEVIDDSAGRMGVLIDSLLEFSRLSRAKLEFQEFPGGELVEEAAAEVRQDNAGREIEWRTGDIPALKGDRVMLKQVLVNLLGNAAKYSRGKSPARIEVFAREEGAETIIGVRDNGSGFDMKYADRLFGVFQRLHSAEEFEGTGIGLANVKRVISKHGGRVWAESVPDKETTFYFSLPSAAK